MTALCDWPLPRQVRKLVSPEVHDQGEKAVNIGHGRRRLAGACDPPRLARRGLGGARSQSDHGAPMGSGRLAAGGRRVPPLGRPVRVRAVHGVQHSHEPHAEYALSIRAAPSRGSPPACWRSACRSASPPSASGCLPRSIPGMRIPSRQRHARLRWLVDRWLNSSERADLICALWNGYPSHFVWSC